MPQTITEEQKIHEDWYEQAKTIKTPEDLAAFVTRLTTEYTHDYGTICHAIAASAIAAAWCAERGPQGGITGFQAGAIMWEFISHWNYTPDDLLGIRDFGNVLYPQYDEKFRTIPKDFADQLVERAKNNLVEHRQAHPDVLARWEAVARGEFPLPLSDD